PDDERDVFALLERHAGDLTVLVDDSYDASHRALHPQELLHGAGNRRRILDNGAPSLRVTHEVGDHAVERRGNRVETRDDHEIGDVEDLLARELRALDLRVEQVAEQPVVALTLLLVHGALEVRVHLLAGLVADLRVLLDVTSTR